ncbi:MAG: methyltransferase domain-containing protein, partial [Moraxellaceae bacterium]
MKNIIMSKSSSKIKHSLKKNSCMSERSIPKKSILSSTNVKFVASRDYETAMPLAVNRQFNKSFVADPLSTLKLFSGLLAQGDVNERVLLKQLRSLMDADAINSNWLQALELLSQLDNREAFATLVQPGLHLLAEKDVLVPASAAQSLTALNSQQHVSVIPGAAHALHWSQPKRVAEQITEFLLPALNKKQIAYSFSRAAHTYDSVAGLQRTVGDALLKKISSNSQAEIVIDLGCGTGYFTPQLQAQFPQALVVGLDIAEGMLQFARSNSYKKGVVILACGDPALDGRLLTAGSPLREDDDSLLKSVSFKADPIFCCGDAEQLPFANQSVDIIYSNFALQWCVNLPRLFAELKRILKPGGELIFTTLGPATLHELKSAWHEVDNRVHVNQFHERETLMNDLHQQGFGDITFEHTPVVMEFEQLSDLTRSLKALGAQNMNRGRATGLTGRKTLQAFKQAYENFRSNNMLPATYDVFY